jgi:hypothetical protein
VPKSVASRLTVPITVTPFNIQELKDLVAKSIGGGPPEWPGAMVSHQCASLPWPNPCSCLALPLHFVVIALDAIHGSMLPFDNLPLLLINKPLCVSMTVKNPYVVSNHHDFLYAVYHPARSEQSRSEVREEHE